MFVYIIFEKCVRRSPNVTVQNCLKPTVGTFSEERIEPALWFKVLLLDSILIDCGRRRVLVSYDKAGMTDELHECAYGKVLEYFDQKEQLFEDSIFYDFDPTIDELFDTAESVFNDLSIDVITKQGNSKTYENLLKILHVFILPEVKLRKEHKTAMEEVRRQIEEDHEKMEDLIQKKDKTKRNTENSLVKQRQSFLLSGDFKSAQYISSLTDDFLRMFLQHLEKDIRKLNEELVNYDSQVRSLRNSASKEQGEMLASYRSERSEANSAIERAIVAREEIKNVIARKHVPKKFKKNKHGMADFHQLYVEVTHRLEAIDVEVKNLIMAKIKLSGVREATLLTLSEIESDGESYGFNKKKGSFEMEADLFDPSKKPEEWATMTERVKTYLQVKPFGFRSKFETFCSRIKLRCQQLYDESKMFGAAPLSPTTAEFINTIGSEALDHRSFHGSRNDETHAKQVESEMNMPLPFRNSFTLSRTRGHSVRWTTGCISKEKCELICQEVIDHVSSMALDLAIELRGTDKPIPRSYLNKLYVCYEEHVSSELLPVLCELYEKSYEEQCSNLAVWLCKYSYSEICFEDKTITGLFRVEPARSPVPATENCTLSPNLGEDDQTEVKVPIGSSDTLGSMNLEELSLNDLYMRMNKQGDGMPLSFAGALDVPTFDDYDIIAESDVIPDCDSRQSVNSKTSTSSEEEASDEPINLPTYEETIYNRTKDTHECNPPPYSTLPPEKDKFYKAFEHFFTLVKEEESACTLFSKLRHMTHINKYIEKQITVLREETGVNSMTCTDDILDVIILLLCRLDSRWLLKLYAHLNLMIHLSPSFMQGNAHDYSLVNFTVAYQHLFEKQVLQKSGTDPRKIDCR